MKTFFIYKIDICKIDTKLQKLYYSPTTGYISAVNLYHKAKSIRIKISLDKVKDFVCLQLVSQLTAQNKKPSIYNTINSPSVHTNYQLDIMVYDRYMYHNYKYILCMIDVYS